MSESWSTLIAERYHLNLPADLVCWLDEQVWQQPGGAEFRQPLKPQQILDPEPGAIWAGFMLPDTLPLISNAYGDWLCLRVGRGGAIDEIVYWCHGGGEWLPYGRGVAEALLYDAAFRMLYEPRHPFVETEADENTFALAEWSRSKFGKDVSPAAFWQDRSIDPLAELLAMDVATTAVRRDLILSHLESPLKSHSDPQMAHDIGAPWEPDFVSWIFDTALLPQRRRADLSRRLAISEAELTFQNWDAAENVALEVIAERHDLGWAFDIAGWAAERRGDIEAAIDRYRQGVRSSLFADDSLRFRTHWFADGYGKFTAARLAELRGHLPDEACLDPYLQVFWANDPESLRPRLRDYWMQRARAAEVAGDSWRAYHCYYNAGWDFGLQYMHSYREIFNGLISAAEAAGAAALAAVARTHQSFLRGG